MVILSRRIGTDVSKVGQQQRHLKHRLWHQHPLIKEFLREQVPLVIGVFVAGLAISTLQYGFVPGAQRAFPVAGITVSLWHLFIMGFVTGYVMALVGQASGLFSLAYSMSVLQFNSIAVSPTSLVTTFLNPFGALLGFWRARQWNLDLALWLCIGAVLGSPIGPILRVYFFADPVPFKALIGVVLLIMALQLWLDITPWYRRRVARQRKDKNNSDKAAVAMPAKQPQALTITTVKRSFKEITIAYHDCVVTLGVPAMLILGFVVGIMGTTLGIGGGFLLVPILVLVYRLPMYVVVAASIPYVIILSLTGLFSYRVTLPMLTGISTPTDWAFGLFVASGAILGAWLASKTQRYINETYLMSILGTFTGITGIVYIVNYFYRLPFSV